MTNKPNVHSHLHIGAQIQKLTEERDALAAEVASLREAGKSVIKAEMGKTADLIQVRDAANELAKALQDIIDACDRCGKDDDKSLIDEFTQEMEDAAREALAKAKKVL